MTLEHQPESPGEAHWEALSFHSCHGAQEGQTKTARFIVGGQKRDERRLGVLGFSSLGQEREPKGAGQESALVVSATSQ